MPNNLCNEDVLNVLKKILSEELNVDRLMIELIGNEDKKFEYTIASATREKLASIEHKIKDLKCIFYWVGIIANRRNPLELSLNHEKIKNL